MRNGVAALFLFLRPLRRDSGHYRRGISVRSAFLNALNVFTNGFGVFGTVVPTLIMIVFSVTTSGGWHVHYEAVLEKERAGAKK